MKSEVTASMSLPPVANYLAVARRDGEPDPQRLRAIETMLLFLRTADNIFATFTDLFARFGLSDGQFALLMLDVARIDPDRQTTPSALARRLGVRKSTITDLLHSLEKAGLIERLPHPTDRRSIQIRVTPAGESLMQRLVPLYFRQAADLMVHLTADEQADLIALLTKLYASVPERAEL